MALQEQKKDRTQDPAFKQQEQMFYDIVYSQLEIILEKRPSNPVTTFADR